MRALRDGPEARFGHELAEPAGGGVVDVPLDAGDADVEDEPAPEAVAVSVDDHQPTTRPEDAPHLDDGAVLARIVVEAVGAGDDVERTGCEGEAFAVALDREDVTAIRPPARAAFLQHLGDEVDAVDLDA